MSQAKKSNKKILSVLLFTKQYDYVEDTATKNHLTKSDIIRCAIRMANDNPDLFQDVLDDYTR